MTDSFQALRDALGKAASYAPAPWRAVPWHIEEDDPTVRCKDGWIVLRAACQKITEYAEAAQPAEIERLLAKFDQAVELLKNPHLETALVFLWSNSGHPRTIEGARALAKQIDEFISSLGQEDGE